jgi:hypothetical protein
VTPSLFEVLDPGKVEEGPKGKNPEEDVFLYNVSPEHSWMFLAREISHAELIWDRMSPEDLPKWALRNPSVCTRELQQVILAAKEHLKA